MVRTLSSGSIKGLIKHCSLPVTLGDAARRTTDALACQGIPCLRGRRQQAVYQLVADMREVRLDASVTELNAPDFTRYTRQNLLAHLFGMLNAEYRNGPAVNAFATQSCMELLVPMNMSLILERIFEEKPIELRLFRFRIMESVWGNKTFSGHYIFPI